MITKKDLIVSVSKELEDLSPLDIERVINLFLCKVIEYTKHGFGIKINGFGIFNIKKYKSYNIKDFDGNTLTLPENKSISFRACNAWKKQLNN